MGKTEPRVLNLISRLATGGAESLLYYIHKQLKDQGYSNFTLCTLTSQGDFYKKAKEDKLPVISLDLTSSYDPRVLFRLVKVIRNGRFNIVHSHLPAAHFYSFMASLFMPYVKLVYTIHGISAKKAGISVLLSLRHRLLASRISRIVAVSNSTKNQYINLFGVNRNKVVVIPNAIRPYEHQLDFAVEEKKIELGIDSNIPVLLAVGRVCEQKGYDTLLKAAKLLKDQKQRYKLLIAGDGPLWEDMNKLRNVLGLQTEVSFLGKRNDVSELLQLADIFVLSSNWEGMPISIIEAMMCGKPIVATAVDGSRELVRNGVDGLLVSPQDPHALTAALMKTIADDSMRSHFGKCARERAYKEFTMDVMVERLMNLYTELLREGAKNA